MRVILSIVRHADERKIVTRDIYLFPPLSEFDGRSDEQSTKIVRRIVTFDRIADNVIEPGVTRRLWPPRRAMLSPQIRDVRA